MVIVDRFNDSTIAYQGYGRGLNIDFVYKLCDFSSYGLWPDIAIVLDMPVEIGIERARSRNQQYRGPGNDESRFEEEDLEFHKKVREGYLQLHRNFSHRITLIDAQGNVEEVRSKVFALIKERFGL